MIIREFYPKLTLNKYNIDFEIIEASSAYGGRLKRADDFADFPIDLGAEWIHEDPSVLARLISDPTIDAQIDVLTYTPNTVYNWNNGTLRKKNWAGNYYSEYKFRNTTWYGFFEQYIAPAAIDKLVLNSPVTEINYSGDKVLVSNVHGDTFEADRVLVTVPIKILQEGSIAFSPNLPSQKTSAIQSVTMPDGLKVFIEFSERFYRDILFTGGLLSEVASSDKLYYDAAFGKDSDQHILGLFTVGEKASAYTALETDEKIIEFILSELDTIFDGKASEVYVKHIVQNWSKAPFIRGSYSYDFANDQETTVADLLAPVQNKLFFAGEALSLDNGSTVPGAAESAYAVVETMLKG